LVWIDEFNVEAIPDEDGLTTATANIACYDYGAYGKIKVTAEVAGGEIVGYLQGDASKTAKPVLLPKRKDNSFIADAWKDDNGVSDLGDDDDSEDSPAGDGHKGDGLTLYEEYRGFSENLRHIRTDPITKDLLIADLINNWRSKNGIQLFA